MDLMQAVEKQRLEFERDRLDHAAAGPGLPTDCGRGEKPPNVKVCFREFEINRLTEAHFFFCFVFLEVWVESDFTKPPDYLPGPEQSLFLVNLQ